jgi:hypothetical protein
MSDDKVTRMPGVPEVPETEAVMKKLREQMSSGSSAALLETYAEYTMMKYRAYVKAGFTADQALTLVCAEYRAVNS